MSLKQSCCADALFRLLEAADGGILIDPDEIKGKDIGEVGLHELRSKLAIIPQVNTTACKRLLSMPAC